MELKELKLNPTIGNAIVAFANEVADADSKTATVREEVALAYSLIQTYDELKDANTLFTTVYVNAACAKGVPEKDAKNAGYQWASRIRANAKKHYGWEQPKNPNTTVKAKTVDKNPVIKRETKTVNEDGTESTVIVQAVLDTETITAMVSLLASRIPKAVFSVLFNKDGSLKQAVIDKAGAEGELLANETADIMQGEILALLDKAQADLNKSTPEFTPEQKKVQANQKKAEDEKAKAEQAKVVNS